MMSIAAALQLKPTEQQAFTQWFQKCDAAGTGTVSFENVKDIFMASGLPRAALGEVRGFPCFCLV